MKLKYQLFQLRRKILLGKVTRTIFPEFIKHIQQLMIITM